MPLLVRFGSMHCCTSTLRLSTRSSFWEVIGNSNLGVSFALNMLSALILPEHSYSAMQLTPQPEHQRSVIPGPLVLRNDPIKYPAPAEDKDRTVSRRSEPNSRTTLTGEQPDPWKVLPLQDVMSRHRGAKQRRRYGRLGAISLLSPG